MAEGKGRYGRREFVKRAALAASMIPSWLEAAPAKETKARSKPIAARAAEMYRRRVEAARVERDAEWREQETNGDRKLGAWAMYSKGLPHNNLGEPDAAACRLLARAIETGRHELFENVPLGGYVKLADPQAAFAYDVIGPDASRLTIAPPPAFSSDEQAAEIVELYWHALLRDVPFDEYETNPLVARAAEELSNFSAYPGPRVNGRITPQTLFRGGTSGGLTGPYLSQFLWRDLPWTPIRVMQKMRTAVPNRDYVTDHEKWLAVQNGAIVDDTVFTETPAYIRTGRDLGEYAHRDFTYQAFLGACLMLFKMSAPLDGGIPYPYSISQSGFVTFGPADVLHLVALVANIGLKATWYQKWRQHMRIRPEEYAGRVAMHVTAKRSYPLHADLLNSAALEVIRTRFNTAYLPMSYPEGSPMHPAYPAGHAVIAGACTTVLKAFFSENFVIPKTSIPSPDGQTLRPWTGVDLKVGPELDKLAENMAIGRQWSGVHWRTDGMAALLLGEEVAIAVLRETRATSHEVFTGFNLTRFDGTRITVG
ncbi:MAG: vanadium-dependent haloperoxidase [Acidobacteriota bacterium]|nr:vanadium-dependent haloperoxidase [Acidobacteriota bacterium]